jgi:hypothetical protein
MSSIEYLQFANISANTVVAILMLSTNWVVNQPTNQPTNQPRDETYASARRRPLVD